MKREIKNCPFCGEACECLSGNNHVTNTNFYYVYCPECEMTTKDYDHPQKAIDVWNKRFNEEK